MKKQHFGRALIACMLSVVMLLGMCATTFAVPAAGGDTINYVSLGDSMTNGYCFDGYNQGDDLADFINQNDNGVYGDAAYPELIAEWLEETYSTVNHTRLAPSAMRAEDLLYLLGGVNEPADDWYGQVENYTNCSDYEALSQFFTESVEEADLITMGIGNASFGAFLLQHVTDAIGVMGNAPDIDPDITLANALAMLDAEQQGVVMQAYEYLAEELGKYISYEMAAEFNIPAVLDITAYTAASFILNYKGVIERIVELNPDVEIILVGLMNTTYGMTITADGMDPIPFGDIMDSVFGILNAYIAGLPAALQAAGNFEDAEFYYADIDEIEFIVQKFDDLKEADWASLDGLSGYTVRSRTIKSFNGSLLPLISGAFSDYLNSTFAGLLGAYYDGCFADGLPAATIEDIETFEGLTFGGTTDDWMTAIGAGLSLDETTSAAIYLAVEDALAASVGEMNIPLDDLMSIAGSLSGIFEGLDVDGSSPAILREGLATYLSAPEFVPLCKIYSLFKIGDGMSVHPTPVAHAELAENIIAAYEEGHTALDETIENAKEAFEIAKDFILDYVDEAYAEAYTKADEAGYIADAEAAIDTAIAAVLALDVSEIEMTDAFKALLEEEVMAVVATLQEAKAALNEDKAASVSGAIDAVAALGDDLFTHLAGAGALLDQAGFDIETLVVPVVDAYVDSLLQTAKDYLPDITIDDIKDALGGYVDGIKEKVDNYLDEIKNEANDYVNDLKADALKALANAGHKHYEVVAGSKYVAIGGDTAFGTALTYPNKPYYALVGEAYGIANSAVAEANLVPANALDLITSNAAEIASADLITYQIDASSFIYATLMETADWDKYIDAETRAIIDEVLEETENVLTTNWAAYADAELAELIPQVKAKVLAIVPEEVTEAEAIFDAAIEFAVPYIRNAIAAAETKKNDIVSEIESIDDTVLQYAENLAYAVVAYAVETAKAIEAIETINPDATLLVVGMYNPIQGLQIVADGTTINAGDFFEYAIDATNAYYTALALKDGGFAFVDVSDATINGFAAPIDVTTLEMNQIAVAVLGANTSMQANAAGHAYIKDQIVKALTCDYSAYEQLDADYHNIVCAICGDVKGTEAHEFVDTTCTKCGYTKEVTPEPDPDPTPTPVGPTGGFGGGSKPAYKLPFTDVSKDAWYYENVKIVAEKGLMNGISATTFAPNATLTRGMFVTILYRVEGTPKAAGTTAFTDVAAGQYYADAVAWANANGIVKGISETEFAPNAEITREQMAAMIARYVAYKNVSVKGDAASYTDEATIAEYAKEAVEIANKLGVLIGNDDGTFAPKRNTTRAEAATLFVRLLGVLEK